MSHIGDLFGSCLVLQYSSTAHSSFISHPLIGCKMIIESEDVRPIMSLFLVLDYWYCQYRPTGHCHSHRPRRNLSPTHQESDVRKYVLPVMLRKADMNEITELKNHFTNENDTNQTTETTSSCLVMSSTTASQPMTHHDMRGLGVAIGKSSLCSL
jgi:hypothetical protein